MLIDLALGLGNPGEEYALTRHNMGFRVVDIMERRKGEGLWTRRWGCEIAIASYGRLVVLARTLTFMNRSGEAAAELLEGLKIEPDRMLVIVDDVDLPLGTLRIRRNGGPGTHNGLRDLCRAIGTDFPRLRIGVSGGNPRASLAQYVLSPFDDEERGLVEASVSRAADAAEYALREGLDRAMMEYNRRRQ